MDLDLVLLAKANEMLAKRPRQHVRASDVLAVIDRESHGVPVFRSTDGLLRDNLRAAAKITGLSEDVIRKTMIINGGQYNNQISKFRCEPGYWQWASNFSKVFKPEERLLMSCSFGLGQKMSRWLITGTKQEEWLHIIRAFMGNVNTQVLYVCGDLDQLLTSAKGERALAFTRYNAGPGATTKSPAYSHYGLPVAAAAARLELQLKGNP